jgi:hypothetical protein
MILIFYILMQAIRNKFDESTALLGSFEYRVDVVVIVETCGKSHRFTHIHG